MARKYFDMSDAWSKLESQRRDQGIERTEGKPRVQQVNGRQRVYSDGTGMESSGVRFGDDPGVKIGEHDDGNGHIVEQYQRLDQNGTSRGTYEVTWEREGRTGMRIARTRRVYGG